MSQNIDNETLIQQLLQERDEMYCELSRLRQADNGYQEALKAQNKEQEALLHKKEEMIQKQAEQLNKLTDQLAWYRRRFWKASSERFIPSDPNQRKIDFDGLDVLPQEEEMIKEANGITGIQTQSSSDKKKKPVRLPLPEELRRENEVIEPEGIDDNWVCIGKK